MVAGRLLVALIVTAFTLCTQQQGSAVASIATIAATVPGARLDNARTRSAPIKRKRLPIPPAGLTGVASLEHMLSSGPDVPPWRQPTDSRWSSCWWMSLYCS